MVNLPGLGKTSLKAMFCSVQVKNRTSPETHLNIPNTKHKHCIGQQKGRNRKMEEFKAYLESKKIDPSAFKEAEPERWEEFSTLFQETSAMSFTSQKLYLINKIRRLYPLAEKDKKRPFTEKTAKPKPPSGFNRLG